MKHSKGLILLGIVATLGLTGCPSDDDPVVAAPSGPAAAEAGIEDALNNVVDPLVSLIDFAVDFLGGTDGVDGIGCPDTSGACSSGSLACSVGATALEFDFGGCSVVGASPPVSVDGGVDYSPTQPPWGAYNLDALSVNGSTGLTGIVTLTDDCTWSWNISAADGSSTSASLVLCQTTRGASEYPLSQSTLFISVETSAGHLTVNFTFDGTQMAGATAFLDESPVAQCTVDLESYNATCTGIDI